MCGRAAVLVMPAVIAASLAAVGGPARADGGAEAGPPSYAYSYELENAEARPDVALVVWPRACAASGEPLGKVDLALNPDWATRMNDIDYEVVVTGKLHELQEHCRRTARLYALPASAFPRGSRAATADDGPIGQRTPGTTFTILPALDAVDRKKRIELFAEDPRVLRSSFAFDSPERVPAPKPVRAVHEVLAVGAFEARSFVVTTKRVVYTYLDGTSETAAGPAPSAAPASAPRAPDAGRESAAVPPPPARPHDLGTRWVMLAAVGGLVIGGLIAFYRKKRT